MFLKKVKYLGVCATTLLTVAPVAANATSFAVQSVEVKAETADPAYQKSLNDNFFENVQVSMDEIQKLANDSIRAKFESNGNLTYSNVEKSNSTETNYLFNGEGKQTVNLTMALEDGLFKLVANQNAKVGNLAKRGYVSEVQLKGAKVAGAANSAELVQKLKDLTDGDTFTMSVTTVNADGTVVGARNINVKVFPRSKMAIKKLAPIYVKAGTPTAKTIDETKVANTIVDASGAPAFAEMHYSSNPYYGLEGTNHYSLSQEMTTYELKDGAKSTTYNQLIPVTNNEYVKGRFADSNYVFLKTDGTGDVDPNGSTSGSYNFVYLVQPVIVTSDGNPVNSPAAPIVTTFPEALNVNSSTTKSIDPLTGVKATYVDADGKTQDLPKDNIQVTVKDALGLDVKLNDDKTVPTTTNGTYTLTYVFTSPVDESKTTTRTVTMTVAESTLTAPTVNNFTEGTYSLTQKSVNPFSAELGTDKINATYVGKDGVIHVIDNSKVKVSVTDASGKAVALNADGTINLTNPGTYSVSYTFANGDDLSKTTVKKVTINVAADSATITQESGIVYINYVWGYGVNLWKNHNTKDGQETLPDGTNRKLMTGSAWKYDQVAKDADGNTWYRLGTNQWVQGEFASMTKPVNPNEWQIKDQEGIGKVYYVPNYRISVWTTPDQKLWSQKIMNGTTWKYFRIATKGDKMMYDLGANQWVDGQYFY